MEFTGERYVPSEGGAIRLEHLHRYLIARELVTDLRVLDLGCGEGYGSELLASRAASVIGIDSDAATIKHAQSAYGHENLDFKTGDATEIPLEADSMDAVVCFETIEHLSEHDAVMSEIRRVLSPQGFVVLSTPDRREYSERPGYTNPFHVAELSAEELEALVGGHFRNLATFGQRVQFGSLIAPIGDGPVRFRTFDADDSVETSGMLRPIYRIVVASDGALPDVPAGLLVSATTDEEARREVIESEVIRGLVASHAAAQAKLASEAALSLTTAERQIDQLEGWLAKREAAMIAAEAELDRVQSANRELEARLVLAAGPVRNRFKSQLRRWVGGARRSYARAVLRAVPARLVHRVWKNPLVDKEWYLAEYTDVATSGLDPQHHYRVHGAGEGRNPNAYFDTGWYSTTYFDVRTSKLNPLDHYWLHGAREGRDPSERFDTDWYTASNPDVRAEEGNALLHFLRHGRYESRVPARHAPLLAPDQRASQEAWVALELRAIAASVASRALGARVAAITDGHLPSDVWRGTIQPLPLSPREPMQHSRIRLMDLARIEASRAGGTECLVLSDGFVRGLPQRHAVARYLDERYLTLVREPGRAAIYDVSAPRERISGSLNKSGPTVSIVVPAYEKPDLVATCLRSINETVGDDIGCEVLVVDDGSSPQTRSQVRALVDESPNAKLVVLDRNSGYVTACNTGATQASGEILVFLNSDTVVLPGWLVPLVRAFDSLEKVAVVGGRLLHGDGTLQEAGGLIFAGPDAYKFGYGDPNPDAPVFAFARTVDYVSGALLATRRSLFEALGGFDQSYGFGYWEDADYCFKARERGMLVLYEPASSVVHAEGATAGRDVSFGVKRNQELNRATFSGRWADQLSTHRPRPSPLDQAALWDLALNGSRVAGRQ